jgi:hypothetical protein
MAKFFPVSPSIWNKRLVRHGRETALLYAYILSNPHRASEGLYRLPKVYIAADLEMELEEVEVALAALEGEGLIIYDHEAEVVLDPTGIFFLPARSDKQMQGAITKLRQVPRTPLLNHLLELATHHNPRLAKEISEAFPHLPEHIPDYSESVSEHLPESSQTASSGTVPEHSLRDKRLEEEIDSSSRGTKDEGFEAFKAARDRLAAAFSADVVEERVR